MKDHGVTRPLPVNWRKAYVDDGEEAQQDMPEPRRRYPCNTASLAITQKLVVVGLPISLG
jgi:hypothetical protein